DAKFSLRFTREARTLAKLNHNNIVSVYEFGSVQDTYFFLMEFVDGPTLRDVVRAGQLEPKHALSIVPHLCDALQYAHDNGVIHRDIKPENILLTASGTVKIVDFGLSRLLGNTGPSQGLTATNQAMGTPRYMAPEQFEGAHQVDHRADIYSLGVVFYELLTGELPIGRFAVPSQKVSIDVRLDEVVLRTLEKEPGLRYQAASEIKSDLQSIAETNDPALAVTETTSRAAFPSERTFETRSQSRNSAADLDHQASAARLLLTRRNLMDRVRKSLGPLCRWQVIQIMFGVGFIALGAACWARNTDVPHRLVSGVALHVFGVSWIAAAAGVLTRVKRVDYSLPSDAVREGISGARDLYLRVSLLIGFPWWLMWIPLAIAMGFDAMMYPGALLPSLAIGIVGWAVSLWIYFRTVNSKHSDLEMRKRNIAGSSFSNALKLLDEMVESGIR
ncbi:MAG: serine/threonine-protein kinase, partial [Planctomycetota bacterium]